MKKIISILLVLLGVQMCYAVEKQTFIYDIADSDTLRLDLYRAADATKPTPAVVFAFGGGFASGSRDYEAYMPMFNYLAHNGVSVISVDYRTLLAGFKPSAYTSMSPIVDRMINAITCAVSDYFRATGYVLQHAAEWNINPSLIFASGSSAGAITVLQAEYELCNTPTGIKGLPADFNFAGVISFAGAIFSEGGLDWKRTPAPMLLFHGDADSNVPFTEATISDDGLYGSEMISKSLTGAGVKHWFHVFKGVNHYIAIYPMTNCSGEIYDFIRDVSLNQINMVRTVETVKEGDYKTEFTLQDFINANYK